MQVALVGTRLDKATKGGRSQYPARCSIVFRSRFLDGWNPCGICCSSGFSWATVRRLGARFSSPMRATCGGWGVSATELISLPVGLGDLSFVFVLISSVFSLFVCVSDDKSPALRRVVNSRGNWLGEISGCTLWWFSSLDVSNISSASSGLKLPPIHCAETFSPFTS